MVNMTRKQLMCLFLYHFTTTTKPSHLLADTGAVTSLITPSQAALMGAQLQPLRQAVVIHGIGGQALLPLGRIQTTIFFEDQRLRHLEALVVDKLPTSLILGLDFLSREQLAISFSDGALHLCDTQQRLTPISTVRQSFMTEFTLNPKINVTTLIASTQAEIVANSPPDFAPAVDRVCASTPPEIRNRFCALLMEYADVFSHSPTDVGTANCEDVTIHLTRQIPVHSPNYQTPLKYCEWMEQELSNLMAAGIIECSTSAYNSPAMAVPKKLDAQDLGKAHQSKGMRLVVDIHRLNSFVEDVTFPMPHISDIMGAYIGCDVFSATDVYHAFYTVHIDKASRHVTAFSCEFGKFQFCFLPQGLKISPAVFQRVISTHLAAVPASNPYIDDILTGSKGNNAHLRDLQQLFQAIHTSRLKFRLNKRSFFKQTIEFAGHMLSKTGVSVTPSKIQDITKLAPPTTVAEVRSLLGFTNFLRDHVPHYAAIAQPIQYLIPKVQGKKKASILEFWTPLCQ